MESFVQQLKALSSAEDFLRFFGVPFDEKVVNVSRLHILKRFFQYIRQAGDLPQESEAAHFASYRALLMRAYGDFVISTPAEEKVFKVFQETNGRQHVSLDSVRASLPARDTA
jgi:nitrogenase-stabilizing/protective protein